MKVAELRNKLSKLKKEELIKLSVEFYKLVPKSKKEDYDLDSLIDNPAKKKVQVNSNSQQSLDEMELEIKKFIEHAKEQYYLYSNRIVPKKERSTWRFKVKNWYKELTSVKRKDINLGKQSQLLSELYELICESCGSEYFSAYDSFQSIGIEQTEFYTSVLTLIQEVEGKGDSIEKGINVIVNNYLNRYTLYSNLMQELITTLDIPALKEKGIEIVKKLIEKNGYKSSSNQESKLRAYSRGEYEKKEVNNNLAELGYRLHASLFELEEGIDFYKEHYHEDKEEIKLYVLIRLLIQDRKKEQIKIEIEKSIEKGIKPREGLLRILKGIDEKDEIPRYM
jgi:hypothetical protein